MNHQSLFTTNKISFFLVVLFLAFTSCDTLQKIPTTPTDTNNNNQGQEQELDEIEGKRVYNPETGKYEVVTDVTGNMETVEWEENTSTAPPISSEATEDYINGGGGSSDGGLLGNGGNNPDNEAGNLPPILEGGENLETYNVVLALPFLANQNNQFDTKINPKSIPALNFYEGAKMAFDVLAQEGVNLAVNVLDTKASEADTRYLTDRYELSQAHLVIGTFRTSTARVMAEFAQKTEKPFVSPYYPHNNLVENNPYFIQLNPSVKTHCEATMKHIMMRYQADQVVLVGRDDRREQGIISLFQKAHYKLAGTTAIPPLKVATITEKTSALEDTDMKQYFLKDRPTIFVITSSNESFSYAILRKIDIEKKNQDEENEDLMLEDDQVVVYGQPRWKDFTKISYDYYENLNLHISSESFLDPTSFEVKNFKQNFFNRYGALPTDDAFKGYDSMLYFGRQLKEKGSGFFHQLDQSYSNGLHTKYEINRVVNKVKPAGDNNLNQFDQHENTFVHILEFKDFQFMRVN